MENTDDNVYINCNGLQISVPLCLRSVIHKCRNIHLRLAKTTNHIRFLRRCRRHNLVPKGLQLKIPDLPKRKNLQEKFGLILVDEKLNLYYKIKKADLAKEREVRELLQRELDITTWTLIWTWILVSEKEVFLSYRVTQQNKFEKLQQVEDQQKKVGNTQRQKTKVINLSSVTLSSAQTSLLEKGLNFVPKHNTKLTPEIVANTELVARKVGDKGQLLVHLAQNYVNNNNTKNSDNLSSSERLALNQLRMVDNIVITNSDKGKAVVVMEKTQYNNKILDLLNNGSYRKLDQDPTKSKETKLMRILDKLRKDGWLDSETVTAIRRCNSNIPVIYGCPKIHKTDCPMRPVVSTFGTPWSELARFLCNIINPIAYPVHGSSIKNSQQFVSIIKEIRIQPTDILLSLDVVNLFGSIPVEKCLNIVKDLLLDDPTLVLRTYLPIATIMELLTLCVQTTFFKFGDCFYEQCKGLAMGNPLSPALANVMLNDIEKEMKNHDLYELVKLLKKFVDDYFLIWTGTYDQLQIFHNMVNGIDDNINFTMETEKDGSLPFLDIRINKENDHLITSMYEKDIAAGIILNYNSEHPKHTKLNVAKNLIKKVQSCSDTVDNDLNILKSKLQKNGYPNKIINKQIKDNKNILQPQNTTVKRPIITMPYKSNNAYKFKREAKKLNIDVVFKRERNIGDILNKKGKESGKRNTNLVYKINCTCGEFYVGETYREMEIRIDNHKKAIIKKDMCNGIAKHVAETNHTIDFDNWELLDRETNETKRKLREAYFIRKLKPKLNLNNGYVISDMW